jgi:glycosyltransferase involved in cell wall biosynthesis
LPEAVLGGETGLLVENRIEDVLAALHRLDSDPALARALGAAARARAAREFSPALIARRTLAVYQEVLP